MGKNQHVVYSTKDGKWEVKSEGNKTASAVFDTQKAAMEKGRELAKEQKSELLVHGKNGEIRIRNSYGHDPRNVKG